MKKLSNWRTIIYLLLPTLIFLFPLFHSGIYITHDGEANIARFAAYFKAFLDLQFPPRWAGDLNFGYGSPVFIFYYPLPGYLSSFMHLFGISFIDTYKLILGTAFLLNGLFFYIWVKRIFRRDVAIITSIIYAVAPYHLLNMYVRGDVAELIALSLVPLVFVFIENFIRTKQIKNLLYGGILYGLLILAHNGISLMFSPIFLFYCIFTAGNIKLLFKSFLIFILGLSLSAFFWMPAIFEAKYVNAKLFIGNNFENNFLSLKQIIFSSWGFGPDVNKVGGLSPQVGIVYSLLVVLGIFIFLKNHKKNKIVGFWIFIFLVSVFMTVSASSILWSKFSILKLFEFPWRFIAISSFSAVVIVGYCLNLIKNRIILCLLLFLFLISVIPFLKVQKYEYKSDKFYESFPYTTYFHGEASSIWTAGDFGKKANNQFEVISGDGKITNVFKSSDYHSFEIDSQNYSKVVDNTVYFPGWRVTVDNNKIPVEFQDINHRGLITFSVPAGHHLVGIRFGESPLRLVSDIISLLSVLFLVTVFIFIGKIEILLKRV